jgi:hypothetical protein
LESIRHKIGKELWTAECERLGLTEKWREIDRIDDTQLAQLVKNLQLQKDIMTRRIEVLELELRLSAHPLELNLPPSRSKSLCTKIERIFVSRVK